MSVDDAQRNGADSLPSAAADRFLAEVSEGAWSDSPDPWEATAALGLSCVDADCIRGYAEEYGEDPDIACAAVLRAVRSRVSS